MDNDWLHEDKGSAKPLPEQTTLLQQMLCEMQKIVCLLSSQNNVTLIQSANGKDFLVVPTAQLTIPQLVQHIDPNFHYEPDRNNGISGFRLYDKRYPITDELSYWFIDYPSCQPNYGQLINAIEYLKQARSQQK